MTTQIDFRTLPANLPVLCIPRVYQNISEQRIRKIFEELNMGTLDRIDIVGKHSGKGDKFNRVYVHFRRWNDSENACIARERLLNGKEIKIIYDDPWFWKISAYREPDERKFHKPALQFDDDTRRPPREPHYDDRRHPREQHHYDDRRPPREQHHYDDRRPPREPRNEPRRHQGETRKLLHDNPDTNPVDPNSVVNYGDITIPKRRNILKKQATIKNEDNTTIEEGEIQTK